MEKIEITDKREKGFFIKDNEVIDKYGKFIGRFGYCVYGSLCRHADKKGKCFPSIDLMCEEFDISKNSAIKGIKYLEFWNIIEKYRIGKCVNNRYQLKDKKKWKEISEVHIREFSEVQNRELGSSKYEPVKFTTRTSNSKKTQLRRPSKEHVAKATPFTNDSLLDYINNKILKDPRKHIQIIGMYLGYKGVGIDGGNIIIKTKEQMNEVIRRNSKPASRLKVWDDETLKSTMADLSELANFKWTLETIEKYISLSSDERRKSLKDMCKR
jgi:DNA-binding transcriptional regulator YhcF (GntR family)